MQQQIQLNPPAESAHLPMQATAGNMGRPQAGFPLPNNVPPNLNLHIPPNKQRNLMQPGGNAAGSPMRGSPAGFAGANQSQSAVIQRMINQGIPVNQQTIQEAIRPQMAGFVPQMASGEREIRPYMLLQGMPRQPTQGQTDDTRPSAPNQVRHPSDIAMRTLDRSQSLLSKVSWQPNAEYDAALKEKISGFQRSVRPSGRATLGQGLGMNRILGDVLLERMPEGLRAIAEEAESGVASDVEVGKGGKGKMEAEGSGMPGQKKRKVQELAETIDKALVIDRDVETVGSVA